jgi:hypothetical protein
VNMNELSSGDGAAHAYRESIGPPMDPGRRLQIVDARLPLSPLFPHCVISVRRRSRKRSDRRGTCGAVRASAMRTIGLAGVNAERRSAEWWSPVASFWLFWRACRNELWPLDSALQGTIRDLLHVSVTGP